MSEDEKQLLPESGGHWKKSEGGESAMTLVRNNGVVSLLVLYVFFL